jgi:hypothetical protein
VKWVLSAALGRAPDSLAPHQLSTHTSYQSGRGGHIAAVVGYRASSPGDSRVLAAAAYDADVWDPSTREVEIACVEDYYEIST